MKPENLIKLLSEAQSDLSYLMGAVRLGQAGEESDWKKHTSGASLLVNLNESTEVLIEVENNGSFRIEFTVIA